ncbi:MAG: L,D-transpeptidase [Bdellovibrionia bacterium]
MSILSSRIYAGVMASFMLLPPQTLWAQTSASSSAKQSTSTAQVAGKEHLKVGKQYYITGNNLNVRSSTQTASSDNILGRLTAGDTVEIVDLLTAATPLVQVKIIKANTFKTPAGVSALFVSKDFLNDVAALNAPGKYFVIQNVASEITRVYERCTTSPGCPHKLVLETEMVVGRPEEGTRDDRYAFTTLLGHSKISEWIKLYQDSAGHYPHWYKQGQSLSTIPAKAPRNSKGEPEPSFGWGRKWITKDSNNKDTIYGAFGWYAAKVHPGGSDGGMNYQWIHGTIGWASDKQASIELTRTTLLNLLSNPGSSGCTRLSNGQVSYLRHLLPVGTDIYRVYAREATREKSCLRKNFWGNCVQEKTLAGYEGQNKSKDWEYIMLTDGAQRSNGLTADADSIRKLGLNIIPGKNLIESGSVEIDQYPNAMALNYTYPPETGKTGDRYMIDEPTGRNGTKFRGVFLVDEGRFIDYAHPSREATGGKIRVSGLAEFRTTVPEHLRTSGTYFMEEPKYKTDDTYKSKVNATDEYRIIESHDDIDDREEVLK